MKLGQALAGGVIFDEHRIDYGSIIPDQFLNRLETRGIRTTEIATEMMKQFRFKLSRTPEGIRVGMFRIRDLGFNDETPDQVVREKLATMGYGPCPPDLPPQFRLQHTEEYGERVGFIMEPIRWEDEDYVFDNVNCDNGLMLRGLKLEDCKFWSPKDWVVAVKL